MDQIREAFARLVAPGNGGLSGALDRAALLVAAAVDPAVVVDEQQRRLDDLAESLDVSTASELAMGLFGGAGFDPSHHFAGNHRDYYDIENSLLHRVLDRRVGIPITLSVLGIEVGRRLDIPVWGVGMPGHFMIGTNEGFVDPFHRGVLLDAAGCTRVFQRLAGPDSVLPPTALDETPSADIARRILVNLSETAARRRRARLLWVVRSLLATFPEASHGDHVQHAYAAAEMGQFEEAVSAGSRALPLVPEQVQDKLDAQIVMWQARLN